VNTNETQTPPTNWRRMERNVPQMRHQTLRVTHP
jgi:hypothetical protein